MTSVLSLDCSMYVGHAFFRAAGAKPVCDTWVATGGAWKSDDYGDYFLKFERWLVKMIAVRKPDVLGFESPIVVPRGMSWGDKRGSDENNMRRLIGVVSVAELVARRAGLRCIEVHNSTAKHFMGVSSRRLEGESPSQYKDRMIVAVTNLGYGVADHHQADAVAVGLCTYDTIQ